MMIEDSLKELKVPKELEPYIGDYYKALCKRSEMELVGQSEYLCFKRFLKMYNSGEYEFAFKAMDKLFAFLSLLIFIDEDGKPHHLQLYPVQKFIMCGIFGLRHKDGRYLVHTANLYMARRNGKSFLLSGVAHSLMGMSKFRNELIILASCKGQNATICFNEFTKFIDNDPHLREVYDNVNRTACWAKHKLTKNRLEMFRTGAGAKKTLDGFTNKVAIIDEEMLCDEIITKTIQDGQAHFKDKLLVTMSTAQYEVGGDNHKKWMALRKALHEDALPEDIFLFLAEPDQEEIANKDYTSIKVWGKANPVLLFEQDGYTIKQHIKRSYTQKAKSAAAAKGFDLQTFATKQCNVWYSAEDRNLCTYEQLMGCRVKYGFEDVIRAGYKYWYLGVDLAQVNDLASVNWQRYVYENDQGELVKPGEDYARKRLYTHTVSWMPKSRLEAHVKGDRFCYYDYLGTELHLCEAAGGENIDINQIYQYIKDIRDKYDLWYTTITADPYNIAGIEDRLADICDNFILQNQSPKALSQYIEALSQEFKDGNVAYHGGHEDIFEKAITGSVLVRNTTGYYSIEKITLKASDNIRIDPLDAMLDGFIANYIDNARDVVNGDAALSAWEEMFGGEKKDGKSNGSQGAAKDSV